MSGRLDSNQRPPEPHSGALAKLRHAPGFRHYKHLAPALQEPTDAADLPRKIGNFGELFRGDLVSSNLVSRRTACARGPVRRRLLDVQNEQPPRETQKEKIMRAFLMCAVLTVAALTVGATSAQAHEYYHGHYYYGPRPVVVLRPPVVIAAPPVVVAPAPIVVTPAPVIVQPGIQPIISLRFGR
jgi:hypothetical protein